MFGVQCVVMFGWKLCVCIVFCQVTWTQAEPIPRCLTGYMTDVQSWVDRYGRLRPERGANDFIDLSAVMDPVPKLHRDITSFRSDRRSVKYLSLARCNLRKVPPVFKLQDTQGRGLGDTVEYITFFGNEFTSISQPDQYGSSLNATGATEIRTDSQLRTPTSTVLWSAGFLDVEFRFLKELDLRACSIQILKGNLFRGMKNLEALYLGENEIYSIDSNAFDGLPILNHLDMSRNQGTDEFGQPKNLIADAVFNRLNNLMYLDLSFTKMTQRNIDMLRGLSKNLRSLSLCDTGLANLPARIFSGTSLEVLDVSRNNGILSVQDALRGLEDSLQILYAKEVRLQSIDMFQNFTKLQILTLASNEISAINGNILKSLKNLRILDLNKNRLTTWFDPTYVLAPKLKLLDLKENNINIIIDEMIKDVANVSYFALSGNFIVCNCYAKDFFKIAYINEQDENELPVLTAPKQQIYHKGYADYNKLLDNRKVVDFPCNPEDCSPMRDAGTFRLFDYDSESYSCLRVPDSKSVNFVEVTGCEKAREIYYDEELASSQRKLFILVIIPIIILPLGIIFVFRRNLRYCIITIRNSALISMINKKNAWDDGAIYNYDVFVSYCNEDRNWVLDYLLPHMEAKCSISVCLHERDFQVGLSVLENIVSCMDRSRSIMLIISRRFLLSQWCQFEMHLAQHRLLETRREDLTLVLLEEIPRSLRPNTLHYLMMTKTYIVWPEDEVKRPLFWKRLQRNLLTHQIRHTENVSLA